MKKETKRLGLFLWLDVDDTMDVFQWADCGGCVSAIDPFDDCYKKRDSGVYSGQLFTGVRNICGAEHTRIMTFSVGSFAPRCCRYYELDGSYGDDIDNREFQGGVLFKNPEDIQRFRDTHEVRIVALDNNVKSAESKIKWLSKDLGVKSRVRIVLFDYKQVRTPEVIVKSIADTFAQPD